MRNYLFIYEVSGTCWHSSNMTWFGRICQLLHIVKITDDLNYNCQICFPLQKNDIDKKYILPMYCSFCDKQLGWWNEELKKLWESQPFTRKACDEHKDLI